MLIPMDMSDWLDVLGCPHCQGPLQQGNGGVLRCSTCDYQFSTREGFPSLIRPERVALLERFARRYREARLTEGWSPLTRDDLLRLPFSSPPGYPPLYWEVRCQTYKALIKRLMKVGPGPKVGAAADLGAGVGWLSYRLVEAGYRVLAVEASLDKDFGLGAARIYNTLSPTRFLPISGDLEYPPLQHQSLGLIIFNASLHYAHDLADTLQCAAQALRPDGQLFVLDAPIASRPCAGSSLGDRHLGRRELEDVCLAVGLRSHWIPVRRSVRWWVYRVKAWWKGDAAFSFPMFVGYREGGDET